MQMQRRAATTPEVQLRRILHRRGLRFRVNYPVPGRPRRSVDIAFTKRKLAIFVDGCFWHKCPTHSVAVKNNGDWWAAKLEANVKRDRTTTEALVAQGWRVLRVWEHEDPEHAADLVEAALLKELDEPS
jgi:DNA mismatch endonuclease (patch repair protein)